MTTTRSDIELVELKAESERVQFIREVVKFKKAQGKKLKEMLLDASDLPYQREQLAAIRLQEKFFNNVIIHAYLTRDASKVAFAENNPVLTNTTLKDEKQDSDYYELRIYKLMDHLFYFRPKTNEPAFYTCATHNRVGEGIIQNLNKQCGSNLHITLPQDVYEIRGLLNEYYYPLKEKNQTLGNKKLRFILSPNYKDSHATVMCHVLDEETRRVLVTMFINSCSVDVYYKHIEAGFNSREGANTYFYHLSNKKESNQYKKLIKKLQEDKAVGMDDLTLNKASDDIMQVSVNRLIPVLDASHSLQIQEDDENCALYGFNFIKAMIDMLNNPSIAARVYQLAKAVDKGGTGEQTALVEIFKENLKSYLPCYYNEKNEPKEYSQIKKHHLEQRWNIDGGLLSYTYPISSEEKETKQKNPSTEFSKHLCKIL